MHSKDIAWLAIASVMGLKLATGMATAGELAIEAAPCHPSMATISQGEDARQVCLRRLSG